ncbi:MAG: hypothetical protein HQK51_11715 [Oligoflexia bacterium]|nr:hypothetical protein [Oligoflexia bacterium]
MLNKFSLIFKICFILFLFSSNYLLFNTNNLWAVHEDASAAAVAADKEEAVECVFAGWPSYGQESACINPLEFSHYPWAEILKKHNLKCNTKIANSFACNPVVYGPSVCIKLNEDPAKVIDLDLDLACINAAKEAKIEESKIAKLIVNDLGQEGIDLFDKIFDLRQMIRGMKVLADKYPTFASEEMEKKIVLINTELKKIKAESEKSEINKNDEIEKQFKQVKQVEINPPYIQNMMKKSVGMKNVLDLNISSKKEILNKIQDTFSCDKKNITDARMSGFENALLKLNDKLLTDKAGSEKVGEKLDTVKSRVTNLVKKQQQVVWCMNKVTHIPVLLHNGDVWGRANKMVMASFDTKMSRKHLSTTSRYHFSVRTDIPEQEGIYHLCDFSYNGINILNLDGYRISDKAKHNTCVKFDFDKNHPVRSFEIGRQIYLCKAMDKITEGEEDNSEQEIASMTMKTLKELEQLAIEKGQN